MTKLDSLWKKGMFHEKQEAARGIHKVHMERE